MEEPIAIIGMGCRFPGGVNDTESFWKLLINQVDAITQMPPGRFNIDHYYDPNLSTSGKIVTREGGFIDGIDQFDADFFNISAYEAAHIDPQQRLLLEITWDAIENAGIVPSRLSGSNTGVFVGMWTSDYENLVYSMSDNIDLYVTTGAGRYSASGRLSYAFDFRGPSLTLDTACSSSLVAIHLASQSLRNGESNLAIAGGANLIIAPQISIGYSRAGMLSPDARCKFGDISANGYVRSEGVGVIVLKRLVDALADGDPIRAVIRGSAVNNDGQVSGSLVAPGVDGQIEMLREAYRVSNVKPAEVTYIEAHGTGTRVGDPVELKALGAVLGEGRSNDSRCWIGSVKTNIGHTEAASGMAGLIKAVLCLEHNQIPASLHFQTPNPDIPWDQLPFELVSEPVQWMSPQGQLYAGVNSFGVTGTNAHVILESAPLKNSADVDSLSQRQGDYILTVSAHKPEALVELVNEYKTLLTNEPSLLDDVAFTASQYRTHHNYRAAFVGQSTAEIVEQITNWTGSAVIASPRKIAFVFPGQGGQWLAMGRQLIESEPVFRETVERCENAMQSYVKFSLLAVLSGTQSGIDLEDIQVVQPAIFAVQVALAELWRSKGIEPDAVIGHSMGEVAAAYTAGILSLEDAVKVICLRSQLMRRVSGLGTMAVVELSLAEAQKALIGYEDKLSVAVNNAPRSVVISGDPNALDAVVAQLQGQDVFTRKVKVDVAAHSPHMDALRPELVAAMAGINALPEIVPIYSTVMGELCDGSEFVGEYWGRNLREPVLFSSAVKHALADGCNTFIEIGPHPVLLPAIERGLSDYDIDHDSNITLIESMRRDEDQLKVMAEAVAKLYCAGYEVDWTQFCPAGKVVSLPSYPWQRQRYWLDINPNIVVSKSIQSSTAETWGNWLYQPTWEAVETSVSEKVNGNWLIFADNQGIGHQLAQQLGDTGHSIMVLTEGGHQNIDGTSTIVINPAQAQDFHQLFTHIPEQLQGVIYLWGVDVPSGEDVSVQDLAVAQQKALGGLLYLTQTLIESRRTVPIWIVTQGTQGIGHTPAPAQATLWGLGRVIREEHPDLWGGLIDVDPDATGDAAQTVWNEVGAKDGEDQLTYREGQRYALRLNHAEQMQVVKPYQFRPDGTYLITGGLGDVGLHLAKWMLAHGARRFILMGRTAPPPRAQWRDISHDHLLKRKIDAVRELESLGASVHLASVDVADEAALRTYLQAFDQDGWPAIVGVIHAAGSLDVNLLQQMDWAATEDVLRPKVLGGWVLHKLFPNVELFINISSINALLGLPGQGNYAAANAFLDSLSAYRHHQGQHSLSINWGVWEGLGYASTQSGTESSAQLAQQGIQGFSAEQGVQVFGNILDWNAPTVTVLPADWQKYHSARSNARQFPLLKNLLEETSTIHVKNRPASSTKFVEQLAATDVTERLSTLAGFLQQAVAQILRTTPGRIKANEPLGSYGLNSLMGMELRNRLERDLGITLSATLVWNYPTIELMSDFLAKKLGINLESESTVVVSDQQVIEDAPLETLLADFATLSDDDILKELMDKS